MRRRVLTVVGGYALVGSAWVVATSALASGDAGVEIAKGLGFVIVTAAVLLVLVARHEDRVEETANRFRTLIESTGEVTYRLRIGDDPGFEHVSPNIVDVVGYTAEEHVERADLRALIVHPEDRARSARLAAGLDPPGTVHLRLIAADGRLVHTEHAARAVTDRRGRRRAVEVRMRDVTDERRDAAALELGRQIDQWLLDDRPTLEVLERTCLRLLDGFDVDAAWIGLRRDDGEIDVLASAGDGTALDGIEVRWDGGPNASDPSGRAVRSGRPVLATPDDEGFVPWHRRVAASFTAALAVPVLHGGDVVAVLTVYSRFGVPFEPRSVDRFRHLCDRLSIVLDQVADVGRLPRRTAYPAAITRIGADHGGRADVCVVVVGRLTGLRRSAGFDVGEGALGTVARRVASAAPEGAEVVRTGDDEITVVCPPSPDLGALGSRLVDRLRDPVPVGADQLVLPVAVGCVRYEAGDDADVSLRRATAAAARGYEQEPFACVIADGELESAERDLATLQELRRAIHDGAIEVWWQPQIDTGSGKVIATEALARWRRADGSLSTPVEFLALAEDDGCIVDLGRQVLREAVRTGRRWHGLGVERVCVNASVRELAEPGYAEHVRGLLIEHGLPPEALEIELVETSLLGRRVADVLHALHRLGVRVAVDDYGTGWSSLSYLARFPFDTLKIDRAFVRDLAIDDRARALVDSTVALGRSLGIDVVAEGVEDVGHAEHLSSVGCHLLQGFAVSPPVPAEDLEPLLGAWRWHPDDDLVGSAVDGPARSVGGP